MPRNGAEQGVAISVAKRPDAKWPARPSPAPALAPASPNRANRAGSGISNRPQRLSENSSTTTVRKATKPGCWNCTPQPMAAPAWRASTAVPASAQKEARIPAVVASAPMRIERFDLPEA